MKKEFLSCAHLITSFFRFLGGRFHVGRIDINTLEVSDIAQILICSFVNGTRAHDLHLVQLIDCILVASSNVNSDILIFQMST
jgi:hypothetical protein